MECWICGAELQEKKKTDKWVNPGATFMQKLLEEEKHEKEVEIAAGKKKRCYCEQCKRSWDEKYTKRIREYRKLHNEIMVERGIQCMERQNLNIYDYKEAIEVVQEFVQENNRILDTSEWETAKQFGSSEEVAAAIVLVANEIKTTIQHRVAGYVVDFILPTKKVVLEIDGEFHKGKEEAESRRDAKIRNALGGGWEIIRIPTGYIHKNVELLPEAIESAAKERRTVRKQHGGFLPETYSRRG